MILKNIIELVKIYDSKPIFDALCYNCGQLLFGRTGQANKQLAICTLTDEDIKINQMYLWAFNSLIKDPTDLLYQTQHLDKQLLFFDTHYHYHQLDLDHHLLHQI